MEKPKRLIQFWDDSSQVIHSYLHMTKRIYGMFGANFQEKPGKYYMQFKTGKDGVNDTTEYLTFSDLHGRMTPFRKSKNELVLLFDFWEFPEKIVKEFVSVLEASVLHHLENSDPDNDNYKTSLLIQGSVVNIGGIPWMEGETRYQLCHTAGKLEVLQL